MPDVWKPYRPPLKNSGEPGEKSYTYRLGGPTCLAGDVIGDYSFDMPLKEGDRLVFEDMALYTMVKQIHSTECRLPSIALRHVDGSKEVFEALAMKTLKKVVEVFQDSLFKPKHYIFFMRIIFQLCLVR